MPMVYQNSIQYPWYIGTTCSILGILGIHIAYFVYWDSMQLTCIYSMLCILELPVQYPRYIRTPCIVSKVYQESMYSIQGILELPVQYPRYISTPCIVSLVYQYSIFSILVVNDLLHKDFSNSYLSRYNQGVRNTRQIQLTRFALPYDYTCFADGTPFV